MSVLIWVQIVCKGFQKFAASDLQSKKEGLVHGICQEHIY